MYPDTYVNNGMFDVMEVLFPLFFIVFLGIIVFSVIRSAKESAYNNSQPVVPANAKIVAKRTQVGHSGGAENHHTFTDYYVTFEFESGDRLELKVSGHEYGQLVEQDFGTLTFQGRKFIGFERKREY